MTHRSSILGVDFGGVINDGSSHPSGDDTTFLTGGFEEAMRTPATAGAVAALARLNERFRGRVFVVSKCGPRIQERTEQWLAHHHFFDETGIASTHVRFCRQRPEKADVCAELGVTHFVDDRVDVLGHLVGVVKYRFLFGHAGASHEPSLAVDVRDWEEAEAEILATLAIGRSGSR